VIIRNRILGDINSGVQDMVIDAVVDKEADLPAQNAIADFNIVTPSTCHCVQESTDWMMDANGNWFKQKSTQDVNATVQLDLTNYYTADETDQAIEDAIDNIDLSNYYTKTQTDIKIASDINSSLTSYYTKSQIDGKLANYITSSALSSELSAYYTKTEIDTKFNNYYNKSDINTLLAGYYTKSEINTKFSNYYTKTEVSGMIPDLASQINYVNTDSGLTATNVQDAIDELAAGGGGGGGGGVTQAEFDTLTEKVDYGYISMSSGIPLPANFDLNDIEWFAGIKESAGDLFYTYGTAWGKFYCTALNAQTSLHKPVTQPGGYGVWMEAFGTADGNRFVQTLIYNVTGSASNRNQIYKRFYSSGGWSNWFIVGMTEIIPQ